MLFLRIIEDDKAKDKEIPLEGTSIDSAQGPQVLLLRPSAPSDVPLQ